MRNKKFAAFVMTIMIAATLATPVLAVEADSAGNVMEANDMVSIDSVPFFGAMTAGKTVTINNSEAEGSVMAVGQEVSLGSNKIGESLYVAGNIVTCSETDVHGNIFGAGNSVSIGNGMNANGVYLAGSTVTFAGKAKALCAAGTNVTISGQIDGDAYVEGENVVIADDAVITGELKIKSTKEPEVSDNAKVANLSFEEVSEDENDAAGIASKVGIGSIIWGKVKTCIYWAIAMGVFGLLLCWLFDSHLTKAAQLVKERPGLMIGTGVIAWVGIPIAALILCITYLLAPIAGMLMLAYVLLLCAGLAFAGASLVRLFLPNMNVYLSAIIGIAVLEVVRVIPVLGFIVGMVADMYLLAYVIQNIWSNRKQKEAPVEVI